MFYIPDFDIEQTEPIIFFCRTDYYLVEQTTTSSIEQTIRTNSILSNRTNYVFPFAIALQKCVAWPRILESFEMVSLPDVEDVGKVTVYLHQHHQRV